MTEREIANNNYHHVGRIIGPTIFLLMLVTDPLQTKMWTGAWRVAAIGLWMAIWWATEAIPEFVTDFPLVVAFAPLGIMTMRAATNNDIDWGALQEWFKNEGGEVEFKQFRAAAA